MVLTERNRQDQGVQQTEYAGIQQRSHYQIPVTGCTIRKDILGPEGTRENDIVLGMPRLEIENPKIDWKERKVAIRKSQSRKVKHGYGG
jgi:hypothetical protein